MKKRYWPAIVLAIGILLRWYAIDWSLPHIFHPDETRLLYAVNDISLENLNPKFFAYGSLPIYLLKTAQVSADAVSKFIGGSGHVNFFVVGRTLSAFFGSITLIILYMLGTRFFSRRVGLLGATFLGLTVLHIQLSHFLTVDVMLTCLLVLALYVIARLFDGNHLYRYYFLTGTVLGLALATKISALPLYGVFFVAHVLVLIKLKHRRYAYRHPVALWGIFLLALFLSVVVFALCEPYAFLDYREFLRQIKEQSDMVRGMTQPPYVIQYEQTPRYWYQLTQMVQYSMGWPLGILTVFGSLFMFVRMLRGIITRNPQPVTRNPELLLLIFAWVIPVFWIVGGFTVKFLRYMLPLIPFLCLLGAVFVDWLLERFPTWKMVISAMMIGIIGFSVFYSLAFLSIYRHEDPRVQASRWLYEHIEDGSNVLTELWEFAPLAAVDGHYPGEYRTLQLDLYGSDTDAKVQTIAQQLSGADAIVLATKRVYGSILRVPQRYPLTCNFYKLLFDGVLGFRPLPPFTLYPSLFGITFNDDFADESFSVYDHPKTIVFYKTHDISADELYELIVTAPPIATMSAERLLTRLVAFPAFENDKELEGQPAVPEIIPPASSEFPGQAHFQWYAVILWILVLEALSLIAFPVTSLVFRALPDYGCALSKAVGILLPGYLFWLGVSLGLFTNSRSNLFMLLGLLLTASFLLFFTYRQFLVNIVVEHWKMFLIYEGVFLLAFASFLLFRAYNPDIFWSESSMDFSILNVLTRSHRFPPPDPWMSGWPLNYYYFGHYLVAMLTKLTAIAPQISYNLAFALFPALVIVEVFSVLYNLTTRYFYGMIGVVFAAILGNLDGFFLLVATWRTKFASLDAWVAKSPFLHELIGKEHYYRFFRPAHEVIPHTVHEFPFWTFIFVDLHAHLLNMPFLIAIFLIGMNLLFQEHRVEEWTFPRLVCLETAVYILIIGTLNVTSSWDYPTGVIFLLLLALIQIYSRRRTFRRRWSVRLRPVWYVLALIPGSLFIYAPFYASFSRQGMGIGLTGGLTTKFSDVLTIFGFFLFVIVSYLLVQVSHPYLKGHPWRVLTGLVLVFWGVYRLVLQPFHLNFATLGFFSGVGLFGAYTFLKTETLLNPPFRLSHLYVGSCLVYASLIVTGCELIFVRDFLQGGKRLLEIPLFHVKIPFYTGDYKRMNTIFKFYLPAWFLFSFAASYAVAQFHIAFTTRRPRIRRSGWTFGKVCWTTCFGILLLASLTFPIKAISARRCQQDVYHRSYVPPTLDGLAYINATNPDEYAAIRWLNQHVPGTPVILEATGADYLYEYARISANTGLPAVLGWRSHVEQREHWGQTQQRVRDIKDIYTNPNLRRVQQLLRAYQVEYIYIGATERRDFAEEQLQQFEQHPELFESVFRSGETVIYWVQSQA